MDEYVAQVDDCPVRISVKSLSSNLMLLKQVFELKQNGEFMRLQIMYLADETVAYLLTTSS